MKSLLLHGTVTLSLFAIVVLDNQRIVADEPESASAEAVSEQPERSGAAELATGPASLLGAGDMATVRLSGGASIIAPLLRKSRQGVVLDLGHDIIAIESRNIASTQIATDTTDDLAVKENNLYRVGRLKQAPVARLVEQFGDAVVTVKTPIGLGSGFLISNEGHLITNYHVIQETLEIGVTAFQRTAAGYQRKQFNKVKILSVNPLRDLALLQIESAEFSELDLPRVVIAESDVAVGDVVFAIGNPLGLERSVSQGIVSSTTRTLSHLRFLQTDASVNPGNSGGPLFNIRGEVVGVACAGYAMFDGLAFGIPGSELIDFLDHRNAYLFDQTQPQNGVKYLDPPFVKSNSNDKSTDDANAH